MSLTSLIELGRLCFHGIFHGHSFDSRRFMKYSMQLWNKWDKALVLSFLLGKGHLKRVRFGVYSPQIILYRENNRNLIPELLISTLD